MMNIWLNMNIKKIQPCHLLIFIIIISEVNCAKILGWCSFPSISHQRIFQPIWREMASRGHEVTIIVPNPMNDATLPNLTEIDTGYTYDILKKMDITHTRREAMNTFSILTGLQQIQIEAIEMVFQDESVKKILSKSEEHYDLIVIEGLNPILFGLQHKFKAPLVAITSMSLKTYWHFLYGNTIHPVLYTDLFSELLPKLNFWEKFDSIYVTIGTYLVNKFLMFPQADKVARKYLGNNMPYIEEMVKKTSLSFSYSNPVFSDKRPLAPNVMVFSNVVTARNDTFSEVSYFFQSFSDLVIS